MTPLQKSESQFRCNSNLNYFQQKVKKNLPKLVKEWRNGTEVYFVILSGNSLIISLITANYRLHSPMYFFLCNLSLCEVILTTVIIPNMLYVVWGDGGSISLYGCMTQFYIYASTGSAECLVLTVMGFDRYLAICNPLRYSSVMDNRTCNHLAAWCWMSGFIVMSFLTIQVCHLQFCNSHMIDHLFCDIAPILTISSSDVRIADGSALVIAFVMTITPFVIIIVSYVAIFITILKIPSDSGRQKTFSTCSSHLTSVCTYFGTLFVIYLVPSGRRSMKVNKSLSLLYIMVTPLLNPFIYSLRNQQMRDSFNNCIYFFTILLDKNVSLFSGKRPMG
ncbi:olfactory receptor 11A1-like [Pseudophryne corroboree]|uniref:olfactory receptor 11A1-like n=1 Tax=Pseudophryne corroboree TaxID=495146 RepID=UPI0030820579